MLKSIYSAGLIAGLTACSSSSLTPISSLPSLETPAAETLDSSTLATLDESVLSPADTDAMPSVDAGEESVGLLSLLATSSSEGLAIIDPPAAEADASFAGLLNSVRLDNGAGGVTYNARLDQAAQDYAQYMIDEDFFSHDAPDGTSVVQRVEATGYEWAALGENLGRGQTSEAEIMQGWTNSPGHHANNINPIFEEFGLGYAEDSTDTRWVLVLGTSR